MKIFVNSCFPSGLSNKPEETGCSSIEIKDKCFDKGGQGQIYQVTQIDNKPVSDLLVKSFKQGFPSNLKEIVRIIRDNKDEYKVDQCLALRALPLFLFEGTLNNELFYGYVMRKVEGKSFDEILEEEIDKYINIPIENRLQLCLQFVEGMHILYCLTIVHADISSRNIIIDLNNNELAIIDLDGGAVAKKGSVPVITWNPESGWFDPIIMEQYRNQQRVNVNIASDLWSIACGVHYLLFGLSPFFFIATQPEIEKYLGSYEWPQIKGIKGITTINSRAFDYYERAYKKVPELHKLFQASFQKGYLNPRQRFGAYQWMQVIRGKLMSIAPPSEYLEKIKELRKYLELALIDGPLMDEEKSFILRSAERMNVRRKDVEKLIDEETKKRKTKVGIIPREIGHGVPKLEIDKKDFHFQDIRTGSSILDTFTLSNIGGGVLTGTIKTNKRWLKVSQSNIDPNRHRQTITVSIDSKGLSFGYNDSGEIEIISNGGNQKIIVKLSVEIKKSALNRFRKKFIPAITLIGASVGYMTGCFLTDIGQLITVGALIPFSIYLGKKQTGDEWAVGCWTFIMGVIVLIILGKYYPHAFSVVGGTLSFTEIGFVLSKRLFSYHDSCQKGLTNFAPALGRNIIPVIGTIAGIMVVATIIIDTASKDTFKEIAVAPRHSRGISKKTHREPLFVRASKVNIRSGPSTRRRVIDQVKRGTVLEKLSELGSWYKVELPNGKVGWIYKNLVVSQHSETQKIRVGTSTDVSKGKRHKILKNPKKKARKRFDPSIPLPTE